MTSASQYEPPGPATLEARLKLADRPGEHLWIMTGAWLVTDPEAVYDPAKLKFLDRENLVGMAGPGCYKCEKPYSKAMTKRRCLGSVDLLQP